MDELTLYRKMYAVLCGGVSDVLDETEWTQETQGIRLRLEMAMEAAEDCYLAAGSAHPEA